MITQNKLKVPQAPYKHLEEKVGATELYSTTSSQLPKSHQQLKKEAVGMKGVMLMNEWWIFDHYDVQWKPDDNHAPPLEEASNIQIIQWK